MRIALLLFSLVAPLCADLFTWDDSIFPPDPFRTIEEKKMKPMVSHPETAFMSGSNSVTALWAMDRTAPVFAKENSLSGGWENKISAYDKKLEEDYKDR